MNESLNYFLPKDIWELIFLYVIHEADGKINLSLVITLSNICKNWHEATKKHLEKIKRDYETQIKTASELLYKLKHTNHGWDIEQHEFLHKLEQTLELSSLTQNERKNISAYRAYLLNRKSVYITLHLTLLVSLIEKKCCIEISPHSLTKEEKDLRIIINYYKHFQTMLSAGLFTEKILQNENIAHLYNEIHHEIEAAHFYFISKSEQPIKEKVTSIKNIKTHLCFFKSEDTIVKNQLSKTRKELAFICTKEELVQFDQQLTSERRELIRLLQHNINLQKNWLKLSERFNDIFGDANEMEMNTRSVMEPQAKSLYKPT